MSTTDETYLLASQLRFCDHVIKQVKKLKAATPFLVPVDPIKLGIPNYFNIVLNPMDLHTIQSNILHNKYSSPAQFEADFELIIQNCILYNGPGSLITQQALSIKVAFQKLYLSLPTQAAPHFFPPPPKKHRPSIVNRDDRPKRDIIVPTRDPTSPGKKLSPEMRFCNSILKELTHKKHFAFNYVFMAPVDYVALGIPTYPDVIKQPMDLGTIGLKLMKGDYGMCYLFLLFVEELFIFFLII